MGIEGTCPHRQSCVITSRSPLIQRTAKCVSFTLFIVASALLLPPLHPPAAVAFSLDQRVACQTVIEDLRWSYRIWPEANTSPKPTRDQVISDQEIRDKVATGILVEQQLDDQYGITIDSGMLQAEIARMKRQTRNRERLRELFHALGNDPETIAECVARPHLVKTAFHHGSRKTAAAVAITPGAVAPSSPSDSAGSSSFPPGDSWAPPPEYPPDRMRHSSVWTGYEMVIWGGGDRDNNPVDSDCWHYDPATDQWRRVTVTGAPDSRYYHSTVWTGTEMIVWGGYEAGFSLMDSGWRYNPATESWTPVTDIGAPSGRAYHTAVWSGSEMIIWGGETGGGSSTLYNSGGRYNPITNSWSTIATGTLARSQHSAVWTGSLMIVWGGEVYDWPGNTSTGEKYDPATDSWTPTTTTGAAGRRYNHEAVWSGSEMIVWGGQVSSTTCLNTGGRYNPASDTWATITATDAPTVRYANTVIWANDTMVVWGGYDTDETNTGARYSPALDSWSSTSVIGAPEGRSNHSALWTGSEMLVWGGLDGNFVVNSGGKYDPGTDSWATMTTENWEPENEDWGTAVWTDSEVIVWGGAFTNEGGRYDPVTAAWIPLSTVAAPEARYQHSAVWTGTRMIVWGGRNSSNSYINTGGQYDPALDSWQATTTAAAPNARALHTVVWSGNEMIIWGGCRTSSWPFIHYNTGGRYDPATDSWTPTSYSDAPTGRREHRAFWTGDRMLVWGGWNGASTYSTGGLYDPLTDSWQATTTQNTPLGRYAFAGVWTGSEMLIWGGEIADGSFVNTGGKYNPATDTWSLSGMTTTGAPDARSEHTGVWTGDQFIVWGGWNNVTERLNTGGRYNPTTDQWQSTTMTNAPIGRKWHTAVWTGDEMVVWGGNADGYEALAGVYYPYGYYTIGGNVSGLAGGESIVLQNNGGDDLTVSADGAFSFSQPIRDLRSYDVTIFSQPAQTDRYCADRYGDGTVSGTDITNIEVQCVTLNLEDVIVAMQVLTGATPSGGALATLMAIADKKVTMSQTIVILQRLAGM